MAGPDAAATKPKKAPPSSVTFHSYPKLIFAWPIIVLGVLFFLIGKPMENKQVVERSAEAVVESAGDVTEPATTTVTRSYHSSGLEALGWVYLIVLVTVVLTIGVDIERNVGVFWLVAVLALLFLSMWLGAKGVAVFKHLYQFFDALDVQYNRGMGLVVSVLLVIPYIVVVLWARIQNKWRITHNEFEHYSWGRADDSLARGAKRVRSTYPDLLELLLLGSGTLIVYSATGRSELRRIHHVPLLPLLRRRINAILETTSVTTQHDAVIDEEYAAEQEESGRSSKPEGLGGEDEHPENEKL